MTRASLTSAIRRVSTRAAGAVARRVRARRRPGAGAPPVVFMFTGLGSEYAGMGRRLFACSSVFRREMEACDAVYRKVTGTPLLVTADPPFGDGALLRRTAHVQPALFAFEYALAQVWRAAGVEPAATIGYSLGEDVAACVAGAVSRDDCLAFVAARARTVEQFDGGGGMVAILASEARVRQFIAAYPGVAVAAVNGRDNTVVAGPAPALDALLAGLALHRVRARRVPIAHAFHSPLMDPLVARVERDAAVLAFGQADVPVVSTATGQWATPNDLADARVWSRRIRETVRFSDALGLLYAQGFRVFVEMGPHPVLLSIASRCLDAADLVGIPALRRDADDVAMTAAGLSTAFVNGVDVPWARFETSGAPVRATARTHRRHRRAEAC